MEPIPLAQKCFLPAGSGQHSHHPCRDESCEYDDKRPANLPHMLILPEHPGEGLHICPHPSLHEFRQEDKEREIDDHRKDEHQGETGSCNGKSTSPMRTAVAHSHVKVNDRLYMVGKDTVSTRTVVQKIEGVPPKVP